MSDGFIDLVKVYIDNLNLPNDMKVKLLASNPKTLADVSLWLDNHKEIKSEQKPSFNPFAKEIKTDKVKDISLFSNKSHNNTNNTTFFHTGGLVDTDDASWGLGIDRSQSTAQVERYSSATSPSSKPNLQSNSESVQKVPDSAERTLEEQAQDNAIASIRESASSALETVMLQNEGQGKISKVYNNIKEYFDSEMSESAVCRSIYSEQTTADLLESAQNKDLTVEKYWRTKIEQTITMLTGGKELSEEDKSLMMRSLLEYTPEELEKLINDLKTTNNYENLSIDEIQKKIFKSTKIEFYGDGRARTVENQNSIKSMLLKGNGERLMTFEEVWRAERGVDYNPDSIQKYEEASAKYTLVAMAEAKTESIHKLLDEQIALVDGNNKIAIDPKTAQICQDRLKNSLLTSLKELYGDDEEKINAELQRLSDGQMVYKDGTIGYKLNAFAGYNLVNVSKKLLDEIDSRLEKIQGGKTSGDYAGEMAQAYKAAYGEKNAAQMAQAFVNDQEEITGKVRMGVEFAGMGVMVAGMFFFPPAALAGGLVASFGGIGIEAYNEATRNEGLSEEAKKELTKELITNAALFGVGGGAAKMGSVAKAALLAKKCPKLMACIADIGVDSTISLLGDLALTGEIDLEGEGLSQIMSILAGHAKKLKFHNKKSKLENAADSKIQENISTDQQLVKSGFNETYAQHLADIIDKKPEIKDKLIKLVKSNRTASADYKVLVEMATPDNIDNLLKLSQNNSLRIEYDLDGNVVRNDFQSILETAEANILYKDDLIDIASKPTRSSDDIRYLIRYIEKYPEYSSDICDLIKNNQNIKLGEDLYGNPRNDIDLIIGYIKDNPDYAKEIKEYMLVQRKANNDTSSCVRDISDYLILLQITDSADIKTITSLAKNPNIKIDDLWNIKDNLDSLTAQEIKDLLLLSNKKLDIAGINYNLDLIKQYPELRDILTKEPPSYKFLDENIANTSSEILAKRADTKAGIERMFPNELKELKTTLGEEYFEKIKWEDIIPANATDTEIKNILSELNDSSKFFARLSTNERKYGKNIQWAHEMNVISESAEFLIKQGKSFDKVMVHVATMYKNYDVAKTLDSNVEVDDRRLYSGFGRENTPDSDWANATGYAAYTPFNKNKAYSEYYDRFMKVIDKKRKPPYPDVTLTKIIHDAGGNTIMAHPKNSTVSATMAHAQKRYEELGPLIAKVKSGMQLSPAEKAMAHEKIAEIYFLTANAMPYARGSNGIADIFMRSLYKELGIDMPALKHNVSLDLEAFCMDLDTYKKKWTSFFEQ